jgi:4-amino-4-deoxy-L-arabinose transferase-like glycosyltransferase
VTAGVTIVLILVGLPLLAWWVGGRAFWSRPRPGGNEDLHRTIVLRHGLRPAEIPQVEGALTWGRQLADPRLRAAVVDWGQELQRLAAGQRAHRSRAGRVALGLLFLWLVLLLIGAVVAVVEQRWGDLVRGLFLVAALVLPPLVFRRNLRRAVERNQDEPATA